MRYRHDSAFRRVKLAEPMQLPTSSGRQPPQWWMLNLGNTLTRHREVVELIVEFESPHAVEEIFAIRHCPALLRAAILHARGPTAAAANRATPAPATSANTSAAASATPSPAALTPNSRPPPTPGSLLASPRYMSATASAAAALADEGRTARRLPPSRRLSC